MTFIWRAGMVAPQITQEHSDKRTHTATSKLHLEELLCVLAPFQTSISSDSDRTFILEAAKDKKLFQDVL